MSGLPHLRLRRTALRAAAIAAAAMLVGACSSGLGVSIDGNKATGNLTGVAGSLGPASAPYMIIDLGTGVPTPLAAAPDLTTSSVRSNQLVMVRVHGQGPDFYLGVFEITQGQWVAMGGATPWTTIDPSIAGPASSVISPGAPAFGLSFVGVQSVLSAFQAAHGTQLMVPTQQQWQYAAAAGSTGAWSWGNASDQATLQANAVVWETHGATLGVHGVGTCAANAFGLYDMAGNVWEWLSPGTQVAGGSWSDSVNLARIANVNGAQAMITDESAHVLVGVRLAYQP